MERLSYLHAADNRIPDEEMMRMFNPVLNLTELFNTLTDNGGDEALLRVYLRVRPVLNHETAESDDNLVRIIDNNTVLLTAPASSNTFKNTAHGITKLTHKFSFSHVYGPSSTQQELYDSTTKSLVNKFLSGQNCLLFTYGATSSGKTYTVQGNGADQGLLPRALDSIFSSVQGKMYPGHDLRPQYYCSIVSLDEKEMKQEEIKKEALFKDLTDASLLSISRASATSADNSHEASSRNISPDSSLCISEDNKENNNTSEESLVYAVFVSFAEIYNETVYDLLERLPPGAKKRNAHHLGEDRNGSSYIKGLHSVRVDNAFEALKVLEIGRRNLHFATTRLNHNSSRSHCIFTIKLVQMASADTPKYARVSMFSVCDLAGAERAAKTQGTGDRLKEAGNINTSLLVLSRCIVAMRQNQVMSRNTHNNSSGGELTKRREMPVPYRDSKLTRLLQGFFLGQGVAAMIVNISQAPTLFDETLQVLKFSAIAKKVITCPEPQAQPVPQQPVRKSTTSQFNRMLRQSLHKRHTGKRSTSSILSGAHDTTGRLSVPWNKAGGAADTSVSIIFGEEPSKDETLLSVMEEGEDEEEEEEDERVQILLVQVKKLSEALKKINDEKKELEINLRAQLCSEFSKQLVEVESNWRGRLEAEQTRSAELHDWRIAKLTEYYNQTMQPRKRLRCSDGNETLDTTLNDSIVGFRQQHKVEQLEEQIASIEEEKKCQEEQIQSLYDTLKKTTEKANKSQEESTKLKFQLATLTQNYDSIKAQLESAEKTLASNESEKVAELQTRLMEVQARAQELSAELSISREMVTEAAEAYANKEEEVEALQAQLRHERTAAAEQQLQMEQVVQECVAAQQLSSEHMAQMVEREEQLEEAQQKIVALQENQRILRQQLSSSESDLRKQKSKLLMELAELNNKIKERHNSGTQESAELTKQMSELEREKQSAFNMMEEMKAENEKVLKELSNKEMDVLNLQQQLLEEKECRTEIETKLRNEEKERIVLEQKLADETEEYEVMKRLELSQKPKEEAVLAIQEKLNNIESERNAFAASLEKSELMVVELQQELEEASKTFRSKLNEILSEKTNLEQQMKRLKSGECQLKEKIEDLEEINNKLIAEIEESKQNKLLESSNLEEKLASKEKELISFKNEKNELLGQVNKLEEVNRSLKSEMEETVNRVEREKDEALQKTTEAVESLEQQVLELINSREKLSAELSQKTSLLEKTEKEGQKKSDGQLNDLTQEFEEMKKALRVMSAEKEEALEQKTQALAKKEEVLAKLEENKKVHVAALRYRDCELNTVKKEAEENRLQVNKLRQELLAMEQQMKEMSTNEADKVTKLKEEVKKYKESCQLYQKEASAVREARSVEVNDINNLKSQVVSLQEANKSKDEEIHALQQEVKKALSTTVSAMTASSSDITIASDISCPATVKHEETDAEKELKALLKAKEDEVTDLMRKLSMVPSSVGESDLEERQHPSSSTVPDDQYQLPPPPSPSVPRGRGRSQAASHDSSASDDDEGSEQFTPAKTTASRRKTKSNKTPQANEDAPPSSGRSIRRSTRKTRGTAASSVTANTTTDDGSADSDEDISPDEWAPTETVAQPPPSTGGRRGRRTTNASSSAASTTKRVSRTRKTTGASKIFNPHLENQENISSLANLNSTECSARKGRRKLLDVDASIDVLQGSPELQMENDRPMDSPHTLVRRKLRSKPK